MVSADALRDQFLSCIYSFIVDRINMGPLHASSVDQWKSEIRTALVYYGYFWFYYISRIDSLGENFLASRFFDKSNLLFSP